MNLTNLYQYYRNSDDKRLVAFKGPFDKYIISAFADFVFKYTEKNKKIFKTFIELAQNVAHYSTERKETEGKSVGVGSLAIGSSDEIYENFYVLSVGNKIKKSQFDILNKKCEIINNSSKEELRAYKRKERALLHGANDNAHIGLIMCSLIANSEIELVEDPLDKDHSFFTLNLIIERKGAKNSEL
ncbi:MAG: SiaB family protein kinase [Bacteroidales bacterium]|nr:SiaB family protein kinase [Bacteroidales bacterium]